MVGTYACHENPRSTLVQRNGLCATAADWQQGQEAGSSRRGKRPTCGSFVAAGEVAGAEADMVGEGREVEEHDLATARSSTSLLARCCAERPPARLRCLPANYTFFVCPVANFAYYLWEYRITERSND
uniref:Uncharacterized protein n=1 Tax=Oryza sativa subsp. japonica TaxID=39947 RepID=Q6EUK8_ORYSJ|nr:hypothetical protein [Oryza sativa Japonica Group]